MPKRVDIPFPFGGLNTNASALRQARGTTRRMQNVLPRDWRANGMRRGAQIPGLSKFVEERCADAAVQAMTSIDVTDVVSESVVGSSVYSDNCTRSDTSAGDLGTFTGAATADYVIYVGTSSTANAGAGQSMLNLRSTAAYSAGDAAKIASNKIVDGRNDDWDTAGYAFTSSYCYLKPDNAAPSVTDNYAVKVTFTLRSTAPTSQPMGFIGVVVGDNYGGAAGGGFVSGIAFGPNTNFSGGSFSGAGGANFISYFNSSTAISQPASGVPPVWISSVLNTYDDAAYVVRSPSGFGKLPRYVEGDPTDMLIDVVADSFRRTAALAYGSQHTIEVRKNGLRVELLFDSERVAVWTDVTKGADETATPFDTTKLGYGVVFNNVGSGGNAAFASIDQIDVYNSTTNDVSLNSRVVVVSDGDVCHGDETGIAAATSGGTSVFGDTASVCLIPGLGPTSASGGYYVYAIDGSVYKKISMTSTTAVVSAWAAAPGTLPAGTVASNKARYGTVWRNRIVLWGIDSNPDNWYMSRVGAPNDWDYTSSTDPSRRAVAGDTSDTGLLPVPLKCMAPFDADRLIVAGANRMWAMVGDPMLGGQFFAVSDRIGICGPRGYARDSAGNLYFAFYDGIYTMRRGTLDPIPISGGVIDSFFDDIDFSENDIQLAWSRYMDGLFVFVVPADGSNHDHLFWDGETRGWSTVTLPDDFGPSAICVYNDTRSMNDRGGDAILLGGFDGYIRQFDSDADDFDGEPIESIVDFAPMVSDGHAMPSLELVEPIFGSNTTGAYIDMRRARTAEALSSASAVASKVFTSSGRRSPWFVRSAAAAIGLSIRGAGKRGSGKYWSLEGLSGEGGGSGQIGRVSS